MDKRVDINYFLRGLAIICIFIAHGIIATRIYHPVLNPAKWVYLAGPFGVWTFILLSGFLIGKGFVDGKYQFSINGFFDFYKRRLKRILPLYFIILTVYFFILGKGFFFDENYKHLIQLLTFTYNGNDPSINGIGTLWFISTIMQLYLLAPFVYHFIINKINKNYSAWLLGLILFGLAERLLFYKAGLPYFNSIYIPVWCNLDLFFGAGFFYKIIKEKKSNLKISIDNSLIKFGRYLAWVALFCLIAFDDYFVGFKRNTYLYFISPTIECCILLTLLYYEFDPNQAFHKFDFSKLLNSPIKFFEGIGAISFQLYLVHFPITRFIASFSHLRPCENNLFPVLFISFALATFIAYLMYRLENRICKK